MKDYAKIISVTFLIGCVGLLLWQTIFILAPAMERIEKRVVVQNKAIKNLESDLDILVGGVH